MPTMKRFAADLSRRSVGASRAASYRSINLRTSTLESLRHRGVGCVDSNIAFARRRLSTSVAAPTKEQTKKKDNSNIFLDNLGKIFLGAIATVVAMVIRSSSSTKKKNNLRDQIEDASILDPVEIDELRIANSELTPDVFRHIVRDLLDRFPQHTCSYREFTRSTRTTMAQLKGGEFTVQLGHYLDRVVADVLGKYGKSADDPLPLALWLATLSMALYSSVDERIEVLFESMEKENSSVLFSQVEDMVGYLQDTCQLPPDTQVVATETKYPVQLWERGTPSQLVPWDGSKNDKMDLESFKSILKSKSVCAWGECYHKKKE